MQTQVWPALRYFAAIALDGAVEVGVVEDDEGVAAELIETFFIVFAACSISFLPTSVRPVKVIFLTSGCEVSSAPISRDEPVTMFTTPSGRRPPRTARPRQTPNRHPSDDPA